MAGWDDTMFGNLPTPMAPTGQGPWDPNAPPSWQDPVTGSGSPFPDVRNVRPPPMPQGYPQGYTPPNPQPYVNAQNMPMPNWMSPELQRLVQSRGATAEGQTFPSTRPPVNEPWGYENPHVADINRLFKDRIMMNAPTSQSMSQGGMSWPEIQKWMKAGGYFAGQQNI